MVMLLVTMSWESPGRFFLTTCSVTLPFFKRPSYSASFDFTTAALQRYSLHRSLFLSTSFKCHHGELPSPAVSARLPLSAQLCFLLCHVFLSDQLLIRPCIHLESTYRKKNINCLLNAKMSGQCTRLDNRVGFLRRWNQSVFIMIIIGMKARRGWRKTECMSEAR